MLKPICGTCNIERRIGSHGGENGVEIVIMAGQRKYKAYSSDKWVCPICGNIEYHVARDTNPFWTEASDSPPPDFEDGAVPIWETIKDAQNDLKPRFRYNYVVSVVNGAGSGVLASKGSLSAARDVIKEYMGDRLKDSRLDSYAERLLEGQPTTHHLEYIVREENGMGIFHIFYITVLERGL